MTWYMSNSNSNAQQQSQRIYQHAYAGGNGAARGYGMRGPVLGEVRVHRRTGVWYVWDFKPGTERLAWLRYDAFAWNMLRSFPRPVARASELRRFNRTKLGLNGDGPTFVQFKFE